MVGKRTLDPPGHLAHCGALDFRIEVVMSSQSHNLEFLRYPSKECDRLVISFCMECHQIVAASPRMENLEIVEDLHVKRGDGESRAA